MERKILIVGSGVEVSVIGDSLFWGVSGYLDVDCVANVKDRIEGSSTCLVTLTSGASIEVPCYIAVLASELLKKAKMALVRAGRIAHYDVSLPTGVEHIP